MNFKVSIITAVYNGEKFLPRFFESIRKLDAQLFELIMIDGGSNDQSVSIINQNADLVQFWISEKDKGIYDAWNKGVKAAGSKWLMFVGCDDELLPDSLDTYKQFLEANAAFADYDLICSKKEMIDRNGKHVRILGRPFAWPAFLKEMMIAHPGALHNRMLFERYGLYDIKYKIVGDYEFLLRGGKDLKVAFVNKTTIQMREDGASDSLAAVREHFLAASSTGKQPKIIGGLNYSWVAAKFLVKKMARKFNINLSIKSEYHEVH